MLPMERLMGHAAAEGRVRGVAFFTTPASGTASGGNESAGGLAGSLASSGVSGALRGEVSGALGSDAPLAEETTVVANGKTVRAEADPPRCADSHTPRSV